jgi:prephenate dehydrogenase
VAGSFRDATRVADINPELWSALFLDNKDNVIAEIDKFQQQLQQWKTALENNDAKALQAMMSAAGSKRREMY